MSWRCQSDRRNPLDRRSGRLQTHGLRRCGLARFEPTIGAHIAPLPKDRVVSAQDRTTGRMNTVQNSFGRRSTSMNSVSASVLNALILVITLGVSTPTFGAGATQTNIELPTISSEDWKSSPLLVPVADLTEALNDIGSTATPGPVEILYNGDHVISDLTSGEVRLLRRSGSPITVVSFGRGPNELMSVTGITRLANGFAVASTHLETKQLSFDYAGRLIRSLVSTEFAVHLLPTSDGAMGLSVTADATPALFQIDADGQMIEERALTALVDKDMESLNSGPSDQTLPTYANGTLSTNGDDIWLMSPWRTAMVKVSENGEMQRVSIWEDENLPDGTSLSRVVHAGATVANRAAPVDENGFVFVISAVRTRLTEGRVATHVIVLNRDGELVDTLRIQGIVGQYASALDGHLLVSGGYRDNRILLFDYSSLVPDWASRPSVSDD